MTNYPIGDFLIRVKNAAMGRDKKVVFPKTKMVLSVAQALKKEGYLDEVKADKTQITTTLAYQKKEPVLLGIKLVSKPGLRVYMGASDLSKIRKPATTLVSTPKGILSARQAAKQRLGGELIVEVW
ncbi:MAG: 30S ribosomal protein S8 [Candidatus Woesebacteria bacterium GW2011_GWA1_45_8]|uniref:Small ribosomal subunit protein uS8 n=1 Tax=Candidatus Woesebacteria bacterium GW2011_GWA1_45_8 TaxID=1618559 RepID=A0A0G1MVV9_9BACT|nr:MAG: 30S ribosomal protein S8 [Candidatus Woesebacteria bacterium GW2011_GWA1_45_8]